MSYFTEHLTMLPPSTGLNPLANSFKPRGQNSVSTVDSESSSQLLSNSKPYTPNPLASTGIQAFVNERFSYVSRRDAELLELLAPQRPVRSVQSGHVCCHYCWRRSTKSSRHHFKDHAGRIICPLVGFKLATLQSVRNQPHYKEQRENNHRVIKAKSASSKTREYDANQYILRNNGTSKSSSTSGGSSNNSYSSWPYSVRHEYFNSLDFSNSLKVEYLKKLKGCELEYNRKSSCEVMSYMPMSERIASRLHRPASYNGETNVPGRDLKHTSNQNQACSGAETRTSHPRRHSMKPQTRFDVEKYQISAEKPNILEIEGIDGNSTTDYYNTVKSILDVDDSLISSLSSTNTTCSSVFLSDSESIAISMNNCANINTETDICNQHQMVDDVNIDLKKYKGVLSTMLSSAKINGGQCDHKYLESSTVDNGVQTDTKHTNAPVTTKEDKLKAGLSNGLCKTMSNGHIDGELEKVGCVLKFAQFELSGDTQITNNTSNDTASSNETINVCEGSFPNKVKHGLDDANLNDFIKLSTENKNNLGDSLSVDGEYENIGCNYLVDNIKDSDERIGNDNDKDDIYNTYAGIKDILDTFSELNLAQKISGMDVKAVKILTVLTDIHKAINSDEMTAEEEVFVDDFMKQNDTVDRISAMWSDTKFSSYSARW